MTLPGMLLSPSEAAAINEFFNTAVGRKLIGALETRKPRITIDKGTEVAALSGAYAAGYEHLLRVELPALRSVVHPDSASVKGIDPTKD